jgi:hypothetical protein
MCCFINGFFVTITGRYTLIKSEYCKLILDPEMAKKRRIVLLFLKFIHNKNALYISENEEQENNKTKPGAERSFRADE